MSEVHIATATRTAGERNSGRLRDRPPADLDATILDAPIGRLESEGITFGCARQVSDQAANMSRRPVDVTIVKRL